VSAEAETEPASRADTSGDGPADRRPRRRLSLALAVGDPNGIGPEITLKALAALAGRAQDSEPLRLAVFGPPAVLAQAAERLGLTALLRTLDLRPAGHLPPAEARPGLVCAAAGVSAVASASAAIRAVQTGEFDAVVAGPHHETAIAMAGIRFSGYPSLVAEVCGLRRDSVFLLLVGGGLRIVHVTLHESVATAVARITPELIVAATQAGVRACQALGVAAPRVGLMGLNPHASEGGLFGPEDAATTFVAARWLREAGLHVDDPQGADVLLAARQHDLLVAMLHDQGHIPVKLLAPQAASALTVGAGVLLATTGHGSAMDIAGQGLARPDALLRSLLLLAPALNSVASPGQVVGPVPA
jgi:4-hydroxythreonine-4-phosphate dehydrogenase/1,2-dihydroxy-3,5-cyclohexadiene-1,4-dicarboxylate dehydrogenase